MKKIILLCGSMMSLFCTGLFCYMFVEAYLNSYKCSCIAIDLYGEADLELLIIPVVLLTVSYMVVFVLSIIISEIRKNELH